METGLHQSFLFYLVSIEKKVWWRPVSIGHIFNGDQSPSQEMADGDRSPSAMETLNYKLNKNYDQTAVSGGDMKTKVASYDE